MSWQDNLLDASWRGITFHCRSTRDRAERALVKYEYPFRDGGEVDDLGRKLRQIEITAVFWGPTYDAELQAFMAALDDVTEDNAGEGELIHPVFGSLPVKLESYDIPHDADSPDYAEANLTFVESGIDNPFFDRALTSPGKAAAAAGETMGGLATTLAESQAALNAWLTEAGQTLNFADRVAVAGEFLDLLNGYAGASGTILSGLSYLDFPAALAADLAAVVDRTANLAGLDMDSLTDRFPGWQRLSGLFDRHGLDGTASAKTYPTSPAAYAGTILSGAAGSLPGPQPGIIRPPAPVAAYTPPAIPPTSLGPGVAILVAHANLLDAQAVAGGATDILQAETTTPSLPPAAVEAIVGNARERLRDSLAEVRAVYPDRYAHAITQGLRNAALAVQDLGAIVINLRPPLTVHTPAVPCNLHLLAHRLYQDYSRAAELKRLNPVVRCPNFVAAGQEVYGYAR